MRVPLGLRSYATDSESGSCSNGVISDFADDSDADSFCEEFHCEADLPEFETFSPKTDSGKSVTTSQSTMESQEVKKSWSEIDEQARVQEGRLSGTKSCEFTTPSPAKGRKHGASRNRVQTAPPSRSDRSGSSRSGRGSRKDRRGRRSDDQPLKGAVVRPYTLPSGPITILRRPESSKEVKTASPDSTTLKLPATPDLSHLGFVEDQGRVSVNRANAKVVNTRFGEGFVVQNPPNERRNTNGVQSNPSNPNSKEASNAAITAMAGLQVTNTQTKTPTTAHSRGPSAESYDRTLGGQFAHSKSRSRSSRNKDRRSKSGLYSDRVTGGGGGSKTSGRPNVFIGRRPKLETRVVRDEDFLVGE